MKAILLSLIFASGALAQDDRIEPIIRIRLDDEQMRQLCETIIIHAYISSKSSSQYGEKQAKEIIQKVMGSSNETK